MKPAKVIVIIPAWDEEDAIAGVLSELQSAHSEVAVLDRVIVVDNASEDLTAQRAREAGATVVYEKQRGYGAACLRGVSEVEDQSIVLFVDADGSDFPSLWPSLVDPIARGEANFVVGSRTRGKALPGALLPHQRFGNVLATSLLAVLYKTRFTDLGPFRAISSSSLRILEMSDVDFGWTVEMQIKALRHDIACMEVSVGYRPRAAGKSKIAGSLKGSVLAGRKILSLVFAEFAHHGVRKTLRLLCAGPIQGVKVGNNFYS
jgi:glycosyltransferase involved in cell wall biosynthesis